MADRLEMTGYVKSLDGGTVEIVVEGTGPSIGLMIRDVRDMEESVKACDLSVVYGKATGEFSFFEMVWGDLQEEILNLFWSIEMRYADMDNTLDKWIKKWDQSTPAV